MKLIKQIESLLFISHKPVKVKELSKITQAKPESVEKALKQLFKDYQARQGGIQLIQVADKYQMVTSEENSQLIQKYIKSQVTGELTTPALETLTIIAYRGPVSKAELEIIRGVNCSLIIRNLLMRGLIEAQEDKSRGIVFYQITLEFMKYLGLSSPAELPDYDQLNKNNNLDKLLQGEAQENPN